MERAQRTSLRRTRFTSVVPRHLSDVTRVRGPQHLPQTFQRHGCLTDISGTRSRRCTHLHAAEIENEVDQNSNGFFTDAFKAALAAAMTRQSNGAERESSYDEDTSGAYSSHDRNMYQPTTARVEEVSASEEVLLTALQQSQANLRSFMIMARQLEGAIDREKRQVERLQFALDKCRMDRSYYKTLEVLAENGRSNGSH